MTEIWLSLSSSERTLIREALAAYRGAEGANQAKVTELERKISRATPHPDITVGVHGGQVQWTSGNPFPLRIVDYDGDKEDLSCVDNEGNSCRVWFEPSDKTREAQTRRRA
jgi:hypothetical protein